MASKSEFTKFVGLARSKGWAALGLALWFLGVGFSANAQEGTFVPFDAPGAVQGTVPFGIAQEAVEPIRVNRVSRDDACRADAEGDCALNGAGGVEGNECTLLSVG